MTQDAASALERAAAAGIHCMPIPTPFMVGRVNTYLIEDDPLTLVDTGPNSGTSLDALERALAARGRTVEDLELVVITHQHLDHLGLVDIIVRRSGAEVASLDLLAPWAAEFAEGMEADDAFARKIMLEHGIPEDVTQVLSMVTRQFRAWGASLTVTRPLPHDATLPLRDRTLRVLHRPGHSPTDTVFHDAERGILLAGDHLIKHISSNPLIARPIGEEEVGARPQALVTYLASLRETQTMEDVSLVLTGHGDPITDHVKLIEDRFRMHTRRAEKIHRLIAEESRTAYDLAQAMWGNIAVTQAYLTLSEVLGHVDVLANDGRVEEVVEDGVVRFRAV